MCNITTLNHTSDTAACRLGPQKMSLFLPPLLVYIVPPPKPGANPSHPGSLPDLAPPIFSEMEASGLLKRPRKLQGRTDPPVSLDKGEIQQLGEVIFGPDTNAK